MKKIAAITMTRNDAFFLKKWIAYYGAQLGEENLYIFFDGEDQRVPNGKFHAVACPKIVAPRAKFDRLRMQFLSQQAQQLFEQGYDLVIGCDTDEFLVLDPALQQSLADYLSDKPAFDSLSALGVDVGQHLLHEFPINWDEPFLQQRSYAVLSSRYTKAVVLAKPLQWGSGFHRIKGHNFHIDSNLYLFHLVPTQA